MKNLNRDWINKHIGKVYFKFQELGIILYDDYNFYKYDLVVGWLLIQEDGSDIIGELINVLLNNSIIEAVFFNIQIQKEYTIEWLSENLDEIIEKLGEELEVNIENEKYLLDYKGVHRWVGLYFDNDQETGWEIEEDDFVIDEVEQLVLQRQEIQDIFKSWIKNNKQWD